MRRTLTVLVLLGALPVLAGEIPAPPAVDGPEPGDGNAGIRATASGWVQATGILHAQERVRVPTSSQTLPPVPGPRGWLGLELAAVGVGEPVFRVNRVASDGPAKAAGIRAGDRITGIDGAEATPERMARMVAHLAPGRPVRLAVLREGQVREIVLEAAPRPDTLRDSGDLDWETLDSVRHRMGVVLDSAGFGLRQARLAPLIWTRPGTREPGAGALDTLQTGRVHVILRQDREGGQEVSSMERTFSGISLRSAGGLTTLGDDALAGDRRVLAAGMRVVGGAELSPLNPQLAGYFGVEDGLLVLQVLEGTPAHEAGLEAGDVIRRVNHEPVLEVAHMRTLVARARGVEVIPLEVVRDGRQLTLEFPRE